MRVRCAIAASRGSAPNPSASVKPAPGRHFRGARNLDDVAVRRARVRVVELEIGSQFGPAVARAQITARRFCKAGA